MQRDGHSLPSAARVHLHPTQKCYTKQLIYYFIIMSELSYNTISSVIESWERLKRIKNYQEVSGSTVFQRYAKNSADLLFWFAASSYKLRSICQPLWEMPPSARTIWLPHWYRYEFSRPFGVKAILDTRCASDWHDGCSSEYVGTRHGLAARNYWRTRR